MNITIECPFILNASHEIKKVGFKGNNEVIIETPIIVDEPLGVKNTKLEINYKDNEKYNLTIKSLNLLDTNKQLEFIKKIGEYLSYLISKNEKNPHYGTSFVEIEWQQLIIKKSKPKIEINDNDLSVSESIHVHDSWGVSSSRTYKSLPEEWENSEYVEILKYYYDGLRAEHKKSKYFHWFLILEYLEGSNLYKRMFNNNKLFTCEEQNIIKQLADSMSEVKKGTLLNLLSRTKESRNQKLLSLLNNIGIKSYKYQNKEIDLKESTIKDITKERNRLFHKGTSFPDSILWDHLFPIVRSIIELMTKNSNCLN